MLASYPTCFAHSRNLNIWIPKMKIYLEHVLYLLSNMAIFEGIMDGWYLSLGIQSPSENGNGT